MAQPDFSIIIPTFNRPAELTDCLQALVLQEYPKDQFEIVVVDDGSVHSLEPVVARFQSDHRITLLRQERGGPAAARNAGAQISTGKYLAFTDDDCRPAPGWLSALAVSLQSNGDSLIGGRILNALEENPYSVASQLIIDFAYANHQSAQGNPLFFASNNMAISSETFRKLGGFASAFLTSEDRDLCDRVLTAGHRLHYQPDAVIRHAHNLDFGSFCKQHFGYGRGARRFCHAHKRRHQGQSSIQSGFYWMLARKLPGIIMRQPRHRFRLFLLMAAWQIANLAGFIAEAVFPDDVLALKASKTQ